MLSKKEKPKKWLIMIYANASDKIAEGGMKDFFTELNEVGKEIEKAGKKAEIKILLQAYHNWGTTKRHAYYSKRFEVKSNFLKKGKASPDVVYTHLYTNMGDPNALSDFIIWCKNNTKAEHYLLLLWGHGAQYGMFTGEIKKNSPGFNKLIYPKKFSMFLQGENNKLPINHLSVLRKPLTDQFKQTQQVKVLYTSNGKNGKQGKDIIERKIINSWPPNKERQYKIPPTVFYYFDVDKNKRHDKLGELIPRRPINDSLTIEEICKSLWDTGQYVPGFGNIEVLMIFGCGMQTFELAYELNKCRLLGCKYLMASEELIYWAGYDYIKSFVGLLNNTDIKTEELVKKIIIDTKNKIPVKNISKVGLSEEDKKRWAISCVDIEKCGMVANQLKNISKKILVLCEFNNGFLYTSNKNKKTELVTAVWKSISAARQHCHYFGEAAFEDCYIDILWFYKMLKKKFLQNKFLKEYPKQINADQVFIKAYNKLLKELDNAILFMNDTFIVKPYIGLYRSGRAKWRKRILQTAVKKKTILASTGAHGINIFFPISESLKKKTAVNNYFFKSKSDYILEFELRDSFKDNWHKLIDWYAEVNLHTKAQLVDDKGKFKAIAKDAEPLFTISTDEDKDVFV